MQPDIQRLILAVLQAFSQCIAEQPTDDGEEQTFEGAVLQSMRPENRRTSEFVVRGELRRQAREQGIRPLFRRRSAVNEAMPGAMEELKFRARDTLGLDLGER